MNKTDIRKQLLCALGLTLACSSMAQEYVCHIEGTTTDSLTRAIYLVEEGDETRTNGKYISIPVVDGKFSYDLKSDVVRLYSAKPDDDDNSGQWRRAEFIAENQNVKIEILGSAEDDGTLSISGDGKETAMAQRLEAEVFAPYEPLFNHYDALYDSVDAEIEKVLKTEDEKARWSWFERYYEGKEGTTFKAAKDSISGMYKKAIEEMNINKAKWLGEHPCVYGLLMIWQKLAFYSSDDASNPYYIQLYEQKYKNLYPGHPYHEKVQKAIASVGLSEGNKYIDYDVRNTDGRTVKLSSLYSGKLVYIDLWASWCGPCRRHLKDLIPVYDRWKDRGFQVIGIAREVKEGEMEKAVAHDGFTWTNLLELKDEHSIWLQNGCNNAAGGGFLIDASTGTILAVYPDAEATEKILEEKLGAQ